MCVKYHKIRHFLVVASLQNYRPGYVTAICCQEGSSMGSGELAPQPPTSYCRNDDSLCWKPLPAPDNTLTRLHFGEWGGPRAELHTMLPAPRPHIIARLPPQAQEK